MNNEKLNVIWILGESIRNYPGNDQYSKYKLFDELSKEGILFKNMVVSTPSTIMSHSSMLTGLPSVYLSRTYAYLNFDNSQFLSLSGMLKEKGYNIYANLHYAEGRKPFKNFLYLLDKKDLPKGVKNELSWSSEDIDKVLDNLLKKGLKEPFFLLINYNNQEGTEKFISKAIEKLKNKNLYEKSIFLFCPDHAYPDTDRNWIAKKHETEVTDANILINFFIKYPSCFKKEIDQLTSSLDIVPTVLDIAGISSKKYNLKGNSLLPLITETGEYTKTKFRVDVKYIFQKERAICIRDKRFKYVFNVDNGTEKFFDLEKDPDEKNNLIILKEYCGKIEEFREEFNKTEKELVEFHLNYLIPKFKKKFNSCIKTESKRILLLGSAHHIFIEAILEGIDNKYKIDLVINPDLIEEEKYSRVNFHYVKTKQKCHEYTKPDYYPKTPLFDIYSKKIPVQYKTIPIDELNKKHPSLFNKNYDLIIVPLDNPYGAGHKEINNVVKKIKTKKVMYIDYNMELKKPTNWFLEGLRLINAKRTYYARDPIRLLKETKRYLKRIRNE